MATTHPDFSETFMCSLLGEGVDRHPGNSSKARFFYQRRSAIRAARGVRGRRCEIPPACTEMRLPNPFRSLTPLVPQEVAYKEHLTLARKGNKRVSKSTAKRSYQRNKTFIIKKSHAYRKQQLRDAKQKLREDQIQQYNLLEFEGNRSSLESNGYRFATNDDLGYWTVQHIPDNFKVWWMNNRHSRYSDDCENESEINFYMDEYNSNHEIVISQINCEDYWFDDERQRAFVQEKQRLNYSSAPLDAHVPVVSNTVQETVLVKTTRRQRANARYRIAKRAKKQGLFIVVDEASDNDSDDES